MVSVPQSSRNSLSGLPDFSSASRQRVHLDAAAAEWCQHSMS